MPISEGKGAQLLTAGEAPPWKPRKTKAGLAVVLVAPSCLNVYDRSLQAPLSMGFPRQEDWSGSPFPSPGDRPDPGMEAASLALAGGLFTTESPGQPKAGGIS